MFVVVRFFLVARMFVAVLFRNCFVGVLMSMCVFMRMAVLDIPVLMFMVVLVSVLVFVFLRHWASRRSIPRGML